MEAIAGVHPLFVARKMMPCGHLGAADYSESDQKVAGFGVFGEYRGFFVGILFRRIGCFAVAVESVI